MKELFFTMAVIYLLDRLTCPIWAILLVVFLTLFLDYLLLIKGKKDLAELEAMKLFLKNFKGKG